MPPPKTKKKVQAFVGIITYLSKFSPSKTDVCESLRKLTSAKTKRTWNATYQNIFDKPKSFIKGDPSTTFYDKTNPWMDTSELG